MLKNKLHPGIVLLCIIMQPFSLFSQGFSISAINWSLPPGGTIFNSVYRSFDDFYDGGTGNTNGSQTWNTIDMNGDGKPDLVVLTEMQNSIYNVFGIGANPYWKVYLNTGTEFSSVAINWSLPQGGTIFNSVNRSFDNLYDNGTGNTDGSQTWSTADMNGDGKPDLVVITEMQGGFYNVFNLSTNPVWKVYLNSGNGFAASPINWTLPAGGNIYNSVSRSFDALFETGNGNSNGSQAWYTTDINGDSKPDLVVYLERQSGVNNVFNVSSNPYWKVYLNTGSGFSVSENNWSLPPGGHIYNSVNRSFNNFYENGSGNTDGSQAWSTTDMNGDGKPDISIYLERQNGLYNVFSLTNNPYWKVYLNTGSGFSATSTIWSLPSGGRIFNGVNQSFNAFSENGTGNTNGSQAWNVADMNGDAMPDLTVYKERQAGYFNVYDVGNNPYWKVFLNSGSGFSFTATNWQLPAGGTIYNSVNRSFDAFYDNGTGNTDGSQAWSVIDMNGDSKLDLAVYQERQNGISNVFDVANNPYWKVYLNNSVNSYISELTTGSSSNFYVYPNPFNFQSTIFFEEFQSNISIKIRNVLGKELKSFNFTGKQFVLEKHDMNSGIYFVQANNNDNLYISKIIVE
jgi:Secretion system C-terminal sorting domain/FG-GAP-like repeat